MTTLEIFVILMSALAATALGLGVMSRARAPLAAADGAPPEPEVQFLFLGDQLEHATPEATALLSADATLGNWDTLRDGLAARFPDLPASADLSRLTAASYLAAGADDAAVLHLERDADALRVTIHENGSVGGPCIGQATKGVKAQNAILRLAADTAPYPMWMTDADGALIWSNAAHDHARADQDDIDGKTDAEPLFPIDVLENAQDQDKRAQLSTRGSAPDTWYNLSATRHGDHLMCHAVDISAVIQAEVAQRNFVQTLAKTFAQLSIGLAIFDRNGQLALFNPALMDLTSLPAEFLSTQPDLLSFFDRLRDNRVMPEPKNYVSWRQEIANVISAASHGRYEETWTLDSGHTFRVSGRPHPDGAVAFLIEDITAEISLTRNFRAELELGQSILDTFDDALAVFSPAGILTFCNAAYREMWKLDPDNSFADSTITDSLKHWQAECDANPAWTRVHDLVLKVGRRAPLSETIRFRGSEDLTLRAEPIVSGATVVRFSAPADVTLPRQESAT